MISLDPKQFLQKEKENLRGMQDARGPVGILSRGKPIYNGGSNAAHMGGGPQFGRPQNGSMKQFDNAISRRLGKTNGL